MKKMFILMVISLIPQHSLGMESLHIEISAEGEVSRYGAKVTENKSYTNSFFEKVPYVKATTKPVSGEPQIEMANLASGHSLIVSYMGGDTFHVQYNSSTLFGWDDQVFGDVKTRQPISNKIILDSVFVLEKGVEQVLVYSDHDVVITLLRK